MHPQPRMQNKNKHTSVVTTVTPVSPGIPRAMVYGLYRALPGEPGLFATVICATRKHRRQLDTSVGVSGPHGFAVRFGAARLASPTRPLHPAPNVRDDRETPL